MASIASKAQSLWKSVFRCVRTDEDYRVVRRSCVGLWNYISKLLSHPIAFKLIDHDERSNTKMSNTYKKQRLSVLY